MQQAIDHTLAELIAIGRQGRIRRGEPPDGAECSEAEMVAFARGTHPHG